MFESQANTEQTIARDVHGATEMPHFVRGVTSAEEWRGRRALQVRWAKLESERAVGERAHP